MAFSPALYKQYEGGDYLEFPSFDTAVDTFFSKIESQNIDVKRDSNVTPFPIHPFCFFFVFFKAKNQIIDLSY